MISLPTPINHRATSLLKAVSSPKIFYWLVTMVLLFTSTYTLAQSSPRPQLSKAGEFALLACDSVRSTVPNAFLGKASSKTGMTANFAPQDSVIVSSSQLVVDAMDDLRAARLDMAGRSGATYLGQHYAGVHTLSGGVYVIGHNPAIPDSTVGIPSGSCPNGLNANVDTSGISAVLTLTGDSSSVFIFNVNGQAVLNGLKVKLGPGVLSQNVFWNIYGVATISNVSLVGTITVGTGTIGTDVSFGGSLLSVGGITFQGESYRLTAWGQSAYNPNFNLASKFAILAGGSLTSDTQLGVNDTTYIGSAVTDSLASDSLYPSYNLDGRKALQAALDYRASKFALAADHIVTTVNNRDTINVTSGITSIPPGHYNNLVFNLEGDTLTSTIIRADGELTLDSIYVFKNNKVRAKDVFWIVNGDLTINNGAVTGTYIADKVNLNQAVTGVCGIVSGGNIAVIKSGAAPTFRFAPWAYLTLASAESAAKSIKSTAASNCLTDQQFENLSNGNIVHNYGFDFYDGNLDFAYLYPSISYLFSTHHSTTEVCRWEYLNQRNRPLLFHGQSPIGSGGYPALNIPNNNYRIEGFSNPTNDITQEGVLMLQWNDTERHFITQQLNNSLPAGEYLVSFVAVKPTNPVSGRVILNPNSFGLGMVLTQDRPLLTGTTISAFTNAGYVLDGNGMELRPIFEGKQNSSSRSAASISIDFSFNHTIVSPLGSGSWLTIGVFKEGSQLGVNGVALRAAGIESVKMIKAPNAKATYRGSRSGYFVEGVNPSRLDFAVTYTWYYGTSATGSPTSFAIDPYAFNPQFHDGTIDPLIVAPSGYYTLKITHSTYDGVSIVARDIISTGFFDFDDDLALTFNQSYCSTSTNDLRSYCNSFVTNPPSGYSNLQFYRVYPSGIVPYNVSEIGSEMNTQRTAIYRLFYTATNGGGQTVSSNITYFEMYLAPSLASASQIVCWSQFGNVNSKLLVLPTDIRVGGNWQLLNPSTNVVKSGANTLRFYFPPTNGPETYYLTYTHGPCTTYFEVIYRADCNIQHVICEGSSIDLTQKLPANACDHGTIKGSNSVDICPNTTVNLGSNGGQTVSNRVYQYTDFANSNKVTDIQIYSIKDITVEYASEAEWANNIFVRGSAPLNYCKTCSGPGQNMMMYRLGNFSDYYNTLLKPKVALIDLNGDIIEDQFLTSSTGFLVWSDYAINRFAAAGGNVVFSFVEKFDNTVVACLTKTFPENNWMKVAITDFTISLDEKGQDECLNREITVNTDFTNAMMCGNSLSALPIDLEVKVYSIKDNVLIASEIVSTGRGNFNVQIDPEEADLNQLRFEINGTYDGCFFEAIKLVKYTACCRDSRPDGYEVIDQDIIVQGGETRLISKNTVIKGKIEVAIGGHLKLQNATIIFIGESAYEAIDPQNPVAYPRPTFNTANFHGIRLQDIPNGAQPGGKTAKLTIEACTLKSACGSMWQGIDVPFSHESFITITESVIQDAERAVRIYPRDQFIMRTYGHTSQRKLPAVLDLTNTIFENNYISLDLDVRFFQLESRIHNCSFNWIEGKLPFSDAYNVNNTPGNAGNRRALGEYGRYYGQAGIKLSSSGAFNLHSFAGGDRFNVSQCTFNNLDFGIIYNFSLTTVEDNYKSSLEVYDCSFTNIHLASIFDYNATSEDPGDYSAIVKNSTFTNNGKDEANRLREQNDIMTGSTNPTVFGHEYLEFHSPSIFSRGYMRVEGNTITNTGDNEGLLSSVGTLGMGKQVILNNTITGQKHGILTFGGENEIKGNTFLDNREAIYVGPASSAVPNLVTTKLELNCNLFRTPGTKWAGLPLTGVYVGQETKFYLDRIGGTGTGTNPTFPGGNAWPLASGMAVPTTPFDKDANIYPPNFVNFLPLWLSPPNWSSFVKLSGNPVNYYPYQNEFVEVKSDPILPQNFINSSTISDYSSSKSCYVPQHAPTVPTTDQKEICDLTPLNSSINYFPLVRMGAPNLTKVDDDWLVKGIQIYPNPTTGKLTLQVPESLSSSKLVIRDVTGQLVKTVEVSSGSKLELDLTNLASGLYLLYFDQVATPYKLIKQ